MNRDPSGCVIFPLHFPCVYYKVVGAEFKDEPLPAVLPSGYIRGIRPGQRSIRLPGTIYSGGYLYEVKPSTLPVPKAVLLSLSWVEFPHSARPFAGAPACGGHDCGMRYSFHHHCRRCRNQRREPGHSDSGGTVLFCHQYITAAVPHCAYQKFPAGFFPSGDYGNQLCLCSQHAGHRRGG